jgi:D-amino-acid dehydrogenase
MSFTPEIIVVGGGIVGMATAYHLLCAGAPTLLIDRRDEGRATSAGAGILAPEISRESNAWFDFGVAAVDYYPQLINQLANEAAGETGYGRCGLLLVAATPDEVEPFAAAQQLILARQKQRGFPTVAELHPISPAAARERFPALANVHAALYDECAARVDGRLITAALQRAALARGLVELHATVDALQIEAGRVNGILVDGDLIPARAVVIAGGAWSAHFGQQLGLSLPIEPQRGQIIHLALPDVATGDWPIVNAFHGHYIVCWPGSNGVGRVVVGATRETGSGFAPQTTASGVIEVLSEALRVAPGLAGAALAEIRTGLRPRTPDNLPVLCAAPTVQGVVIAAGHGATGLQLGPLTGKIAAGLALGESPDLDIRALHINRFQ